MSFLSGIFLFALPLIGIPIALHFYRGRQVDVIDWGAMHFLEDAVSEGRRWEKLEELLLMLLRVVAIAALVLALARPEVSGSWLGQYERREVILVIDDSLSTAVEGSSGVVLEQVKRQAIDAVGDLTGEDRVQVLAAAAGGRWLTTEAISANSAGKRRLSEVIKSMSPTQGSTDLLGALRVAEQYKVPDLTSARVTMVFTDGQANSYAAETEAWAKWQDLQAQNDHPMEVRILECGLGTAAPSNLAVAGASASREVVRKGEKVTLTCDVANFGDVPSKETKVEWSLGEEVIATAEVPAIAPGEISKPSTTAKLEKPGPQRLSCKLTSEDDLPLDQSASVMVEVSNSLPVLIVRAEEGSDGVEITASEHLTGALGYLDGKPQPWRSVYKPDVVEAEELNDMPLSKYRAIVINAPETLTRDTIDRLRGYVATGGGLWITLGEAIDADRFNAQWYDDGEGLCPMALDRLPKDDASGDFVSYQDEAGAREASIHPPDGDHPATRQLGNTTQLDIDKTLLARHWLFHEQEEQDMTTAADASVLLRSDTGAPLAIERYFGRGRVIIQAFGLDLAWSNLPLRKAYVVMVHDWLDYLAAPAQGRYNLAPGAPIVAQAPTSELTGSDATLSARMVTPSGEEVQLATREDMADRVFRYTQTRVPGEYRLQFLAGSEMVHEVIYQTPRQLEESRLDALTDAKRTEIIAQSGWLFNDQAPDPQAVSAATPPSRAPFWWTLLALLAALLVGELLMASRVSWRRMGVPLTTSHS